MEASGDCQLINGYGPTETTTFACYSLIAEAELEIYRYRLAGRSVTRRFMCWMLICILYRSELAGSFTLGVLDLRGAILAVLV